MAYEYDWHEIEIVVKEDYLKLKRKAKCFDEVKEFVDKKIKEEEEKPRNILDDYDYGLNQAYNHVDDIIQEHMESADDET